MPPQQHFVIRASNEGSFFRRTLYFDLFKAFNYKENNIDVLVWKAMRHAIYITMLKLTPPYIKLLCFNKTILISLISFDSIVDTKDAAVKERRFLCVWELYNRPIDLCGFVEENGQNIFLCLCLCLSFSLILILPFKAYFFYLYCL